MAGRTTKQGAVHIQVTAARSAVSEAQRLLAPRRAKLDKLPGYSFREFLGLDEKLDQLQSLQRLLGEKDAARSVSGVSHSLPELYAARRMLLRRAKADVDLKGKVVTPELLAAVLPGSGSKDAVDDLTTLATTYLKPGAPKTPYTPAQLKALVQTASTMSKQLGVKPRDADRQSLAERRDALSQEIARVWKLTVLASAWFDAVEGVETRLPSLLREGRKGSKKKPAPVPAPQPG